MVTLGHNFVIFMWGLVGKYGDCNQTTMVKVALI